MRIGFFTDTYLPVIHGVNISIETLRKALEKIGHEVFIYAPEHPGYKDENSNVFRFKSKRVIKNPEIRHAFIFLPKNGSIKKAVNFKLDIAHAHTPFAMGILAKYISKRQSIPLFYTHHTDYIQYAKAYFKEKIFLPRLSRAYTVRFANFTDAIIAPSLKVKEILLDQGVKKNIPIYTVPNSVNLKIFKKSLTNRKILRKELKISSDKKVLITVSRLGKEKNIEVLIRSFAKIKKEKNDALLFVIGDGPDLKRLKEIARKENLENSIIFKGSIPHQDIVKYYQMADLFIFASLTDVHPLVILEAFACGLPAVALKDNAFTNLILNNKNGFLINPKNSNKTELFAQKTTKILKEQDIYNKFSKKALETSKNFSEEKSAKKLLKIYYSIKSKDK